MDVSEAQRAALISSTVHWRLSLCRHVFLHSLTSPLTTHRSHLHPFSQPSQSSRKCPNEQYNTQKISPLQIRYVPPPPKIQSNPLVKSKSIQYRSEWKSARSNKRNCLTAHVYLGLSKAAPFCSVPFHVPNRIALHAILVSLFYVHTRPSKLKKAT